MNSTQDFSTGSQAPGPDRSGLNPHDPAPAKGMAPAVSVLRAEGLAAHGQEGVSRPHTAVKPAMLEVLRNKLQNPIALRVGP